LQAQAAQKSLYHSASHKPTKIGGMSQLQLPCLLEYFSCQTDHSYLITLAGTGNSTHLSTKHAQFNNTKHMGREHKEPTWATRSNRKETQSQAHNCLKFTVYRCWI